MNPAKTRDKIEKRQCTRVSPLRGQFVVWPSARPVEKEEWNMKISKALQEFGEKGQELSSVRGDNELGQLDWATS